MTTALITGATAGIGAAFARRLASDGHALVLVARQSPRLDETARRLREEFGVDVEALPADLAGEEGIAAVEARLADREAPVDLLVNNAGFGQRGGFLKVPVEDELAMLRVHVEAVLRLTSAAAVSMRERGRGGIVNVASVAAFFARGTYGASKAWVVSFSRGVAQDLAGSGVRITAVCPGFTRTEFHERAGMDVSGVGRPLWLSAQEVVDTALRDVARGRVVSIPGWQYRTLVGLGRLTPSRLAERISSRSGRKYRD
ncbi:SDR family NAD(P)-dependent oxidoreductase [Wenjunlia tyrosinilytica]|nr:SDR family oxidoreductase [Wenjunlia tyrosinilytica]